MRPTDVPAHTDVSEHVWPFINQVIETGSILNTSTSDPCLPLYFLVQDRQHMRPMIRDNVLWPRGKANASGSKYDPYYLVDAGLYVFPDVHTMFESMHDMYEDAAHDAPFASYEMHYLALKRFYKCISRGSDRFGGANSEEHFTDADRNSSTLLKGISKRAFAEAISTLMAQNRSSSCQEMVSYKAPVQVKHPNAWIVGDVVGTWGNVEE